MKTKKTSEIKLARRKCGKVNIREKEIMKERGKATQTRLRKEVVGEAEEKNEGHERQETRE